MQGVGEGLGDDNAISPRGPGEGEGEDGGLVYMD